MEYSNFDLRIDRDSGGFKARVSDPLLGEAEHPFSPVFSSDEVEESLADLGPAREVRSVWQKPRLEKVAQEIGSKLFAAIFVGEVQIFWRLSLLRAQQEGRGVRLRLFTRDPESSRWPWEFLFDPDRRFLALSAATPILRYLELPIPPRSLRAELPLRILVVVAEPSGCSRLDVEGEWEDLKKAVKDLERRGDVWLDRLTHATFSSLRQKLQESFHILHFVGHGTFVEDRGTLLFEDGPVDGGDLATILRDHDSLRLVVLNACAGAQSSGTERFSGVAQNLIHGGIPAVIAMQFRVTDRAAIAFAETFYQEIARGIPVDAALAEARRAMFCWRHSVEWGTPVLFSRSPNGDLFGLPERPPPPRPWWRVVGLSTLLMAGAFAIITALRFVDFPDGCPPSELLRLEFVRIEPAVFVMESKERTGKDQVYEVEITRPYCISVSEVTQKQWAKVMNYNPSTHKGEGKLPVENVSYDDAEKFIAELNRLEPGEEYSLPTEAQWQLAAQAGTELPYSFGEEPNELPRYGNCLGKDEFDGTAPVKSFEPNRWGLYDMHGNVSEWVKDWEGEYPWGRYSDPEGPRKGERRVRRGGSWKVVAKSCTATKRNSSEPDYRSNDVGFRLVRTPEN